MDKMWRLTGLLLLLLGAGEAMAATCTTNAGTGAWTTVSTWSCGHIPVAADTVVISRNITAVATTVTGLVVNAGITLTDGGNTVNVTGNLTNNGIITGGGRMNVTGAASVISGNGTYTNSRLYTSGAAPTIPAGAILNFTGSSRIYTGRTSAGTNALTSVLTINGTINSTVTTATTNFLRLYATSTIVGNSGVINASVSAVTYNNATATLTNNGNVTVQKITRNSTTNKWMQGTNSNLTLSLTSTVGTLYASATGNTVTYNGTSATNVSINTLSPANTYYNLAGSAVVCPTAFTILGTSPCVAGSYAVTRSLTSCVNVTGIGSIAWTSLTNAYASDNLYTVATNVIRNTTTNYLRCTGYGFAIPVGATINGITVNVERKTSGGTIYDAAMRVVKDVAGVATIQATDRSTLTRYLTGDVIEAHGGVADLWGSTWTVADINATNFGAAIAAKNTSTTSTTNRTVSIDHMPITVVYTPASAPDHVSISAANVGSTCNPSTVTIKLHNAAHALTSGWTGTINLTTSDSRGDWSSVTAGGVLNNGTTNDGAATYTFTATENTITLNLAHTTTGTITIGVASGATNLLTKTPAGELANSITYPNGGSFSIVSNASGTPVPVTNLDQVSGQASPVYYLYATNTACAAAFNNVTQTIQFASECNDPTTCQNAPAVATITPYSSNGVTAGTPVALQKGLANNSILPTAGQYTNVAMNFNASSRAPFTLSYADAGMITLYINYVNGGTTIFSESNPFVVKPAGFVLSGIKRSSDNFANPAAADATGAAFIKAGSAFSATVNALTVSGKIKADAGTAINCATTPTDCTPNFGQEVNKESVMLTPALATGLGLTNPGTVSGTLGAFSGGIASGSAFSWDEVGIITLTPHIAGDSSYLGAGDVVGTTSAKIGRFYPDHFSVIPDADTPIDDRSDLDFCSQGLLLSDGVTPCVAASQCVNGVLLSDGVTACAIAPGFTYMGEQMALNFTLVAENSTDTTTQNYVASATAANNFAKLNPVASGGALALGAVDTATDMTTRIDSSLIVTNGSGSFSNGSATISVPIAITRDVAPDGPYTSMDIGIAPVDSDGVTMGAFDMDVHVDGSNDHALIGSTEVRYGRMNIANAAGSNLLPLPITLTAQYWNNGDYMVSADDNNTVLAIADVVLNPYQRKSGDAWTASVTALANGGVAASGICKATLSKPVGTFTGQGSVGIATSAPLYLPSNTAHATFGVYRGNKELIYLRENY